jgi:predicted acylesterase/phospholipase RssA
MNKASGSRNNNDVNSDSADLHADLRPIAYAGPTQIVYEGSEVLLEGSSNLDHGKIVNRNISYSWSLDQVDSDDSNNLQIKLQSVEANTRNATFMAPYVYFDPSKSDNQTYVSLLFKLVVIDKRSGLESDPSYIMIIVKMVQRALILQGGGSLGAYEVGVFRALCERLSKQDEESNIRKNRPLFDIIAGTSIGALNAALIVNSVKKSMQDNGLKGLSGKIWEKSVIDLERFWEDISYPIPLFENQLFDIWWNFLHNTTTGIYQWIQKYQDMFGYFNLPFLDPEINTFNPFYLFMRPDMFTPAADSESARRYFSWLLFPYLFPNKVVTPNFPQPDTKFFTGVPRLIRFENNSIVRTAKVNGYWDYERDPIKTDFQKGEPRLLLVAIDIQDATSTVTFDSYLCESRYRDGSHPRSEHIIRYPKGISMKHVKASMSPHTVIDYPWLEDEQDDISRVSGSNSLKRRYFWDGAYLSNTPLREVLHLHRFYWYTIQKDQLGDSRSKGDASKNINIDDKINEFHVPHLEVYIANLYPTVEQEQEKPPIEPDIIQDRELDIRFHDKTRYDIKVSEMITDYIILHGQMKNLALKHIGVFDRDKIREFEDEYQSLLGGLTHSHKRSNEDDLVTRRDDDDGDTTDTKRDRTYYDLIKGRFDVTRVTYIDRKDDKDIIFGKAADFSKKTMSLLKGRGYKDTLAALDAATKITSSQSYRILT